MGADPDVFSLVTDFELAIKYRAHGASETPG